MAGLSVYSKGVASSNFQFNLLPQKRFDLHFFQLRIIRESYIQSKVAPGQYSIFQKNNTFYKKMLKINIVIEKILFL